jgi:type VI secretion system protein ImpH
MTTAAPTAPAPLANVEKELRDRPGLFDFFQAVRLILQIIRDREPVGTFAKPSTEAVRFNANNSLAFPPTETQSIDWEGDVPRMLVNFMGLTGPAGVLPYCYSEMVTARVRERDHTMRAFFDIFNHRMISLFYQAWEKYRSGVAYERDGRDRLSKYLMCLIGMGTGGLQRRLVVRDQSLLFYTGLLGLHARSAVALERILEDYFGVPAEVDGDEIWDQQSRVRVKLGPLAAEQYLAFLPGGEACDPLRDLVRFYCGMQFEIEVQLILKQDEVPNCNLGKPDLAGPRLGWFTWMKSGDDFDRAPADTVFLLG